MSDDARSAPQARTVTPDPSVQRSLFDAYRPLPGVPDELCDTQGRMRSGWAPLIDHLSGLTRNDAATAFARGEQHLANAGVFFRKYGDQTAASRNWPYSPIPVVLSQTDWDTIGDGLIQRADLLEQVAADLYGPNRLVADGHLPAQLIASNPEWLRPLVGTRPRGGHFLHFCAFELGRGPDGRWWVLQDLTDAPSGAGFALENRIAATHVFPDLFERANVHRLAGFFQDFRQALTGLKDSPDSRVGILTPGPLTDTYYEQAYIARYLGLSLLEGGDLTASDGRLFVRTVKGLIPVEVLWRRMDGIWSDPLELRSDSRLGTPGLISAIREGHVTMVNALGVGVLETQALMAFLPSIAQVLTGADLKLPNVATWWCGQPRELEHVQRHASRMMIGPALATRMPYDTQAAHAIGGSMFGAQGEKVAPWLSANAQNLMAKELVTLSTTPVYEKGALVPRPMTLRVFLARGADGWQVMPGGFARIGTGRDTSAVSMRRGGAVADVWVVADRPVATPTLLVSDPATPFTRATPEALPSRAADNLFWLGRYIERTEGLLRLLRAYHGRRSEGVRGALPDLIVEMLDRYGVEAAAPIPDGLRQTLWSAVRSASQIRDRFSVDGWAALTDMDKTLSRMQVTARPGDDAALATGVLLRKAAGFAGLTHENMYRSAGWQFLSVGRALERAAMTAGLLADLADPAAPGGALDLAVEIGDSIIVHRQRYAMGISRDTVIDLLALDPCNPRAIRFQLDALLVRVADMTHDAPQGHITDFERGVRILQTAFAVHTVDTLDTAALRKALSDIWALSVTLNAAFLH
ncbi:circularly permuted type 2 ATP-grasp protein [Loktanella sp. DJP18]|uniref:circularly permuted type 2 ATP-grasp protein n=1 Tax=Loktanella sp. DJP18 TaxID=3409788 RepID=UPI003BB696BA